MVFMCLFTIVLFFIGVIHNIKQNMFYFSITVTTVNDAEQEVETCSGTNHDLLLKFVYYY